MHTCTCTVHADTGIHINTKFTCIYTDNKAGHVHVSTHTYPTTHVITQSTLSIQAL